MKYRHILAAVDTNALEQPVAARARRWAVRCNARLSLLSVAPELKQLIFGADHGLLRTLQDEQGQRVLAALRNHAQTLGLSSSQVDVHVNHGWPDRNIAAYAIANRCELIVMGGYPHFELQHLLGDTLTRVVAQTSADVLAVIGEASVPDYKKVLIAVNAQPTEKHILGRALEIVPSAASVDILFVQRQKNLTILSEKVRETASTEFRRPHQFLQLQGNATTQISSCAKTQGYDLMIIGSGHRAGRPNDMGSTTRRLLRKMHCDTLVVHNLSPPD